MSELREYYCNKCSSVGFNKDHLETHHCLGLEPQITITRAKIIEAIHSLNLCNRDQSFTTTKAELEAKLLKEFGL